VKKLQNMLSEGARIGQSNDKSTVNYAYGEKSKNFASNKSISHVSHKDRKGGSTHYDDQVEPSKSMVEPVFSEKGV